MKKFITEYMAKCPEAEFIRITINAIKMLFGNLCPGAPPLGLVQSLAYIYRSSPY